MFAEASPSLSAIGERALRRQIDVSIGRALVDGTYASLLLKDPTMVLEDRGCAPQQYRSLRSIHATNVFDFAQQARALFWLDESIGSSLNDRRVLAAVGH